MAQQEADKDTTNMLKPDDEYYIRYFFLLTRGGTELLRAIFEQALQQKGEDLNHFLSSVKPAIQHSRHLTQEQKDILYPATQGALIEKFDITLLSQLIIRHLPGYVDRNVLPSVEKIRDLRNKYAHQAESTMDTFTFYSEWNDLLTIIRNGLLGISKEVKERIINLIDSINLRNQSMRETILNDIKILVKKEDFTQSIQRKFEDIQTCQNKLVEQIGNVQDTLTLTLEEVQEIKAEIRKNQEKRGEEIKIDATIRGHAQINPPDEETKVKVLNLLAEAYRILNTGSPPRDEVQENLAAFCQDVEHRDVKLMNISSGSIVFEFQCCSLTAIVDLIDYFYCPLFQKRLNAIAEALGVVIGKTICITANGINRQSLEYVTSKIKKNYQNVMQFEMSCMGIDGLSHVMEVFEGGKAAGSLNKLSKALSNAVGKPVTLHTSLDMDQMKTALQSIRNRLDLKQSTNDRDEEILEDIAPVSDEEPGPTEERSYRKTFISTAWDWTRNIFTSGYQYLKNMINQRSQPEIAIEELLIHLLLRKQEEQNRKLKKKEIEDLLQRKHYSGTKFLPAFQSKFQQNFETKPQSEESEIEESKTEESETEEFFMKKVKQISEHESDIEKLYVKNIQQRLEHESDTSKLYRKKYEQNSKQKLEFLESFGEHYSEHLSDIKELYYDFDKKHIDQNSEHGFGIMTELHQHNIKNTLPQWQSEKEIYNPGLDQQEVNKSFKEQSNLSLDQLEVAKPFKKQSYPGLDQLEVTKPFKKQSYHGLDQKEVTKPFKLQSYPGLDQLEVNKVCLIFKTDINIKLADEIISVITGCDLLPPDRLLVVDNVNKNLKIVNIQTDSLVEKIDLYTWPFDIALLPNYQIAVTLPEEKAILILSTTEKLAKTDLWKVKAKPWGITHQKEKVYVLCCNDWYELLSVTILNLSGERLKEISVKTRDDDSFGCGGHIALSKDVQHLYIHDCLRKCVLKVALTGDKAVEKSNINLQQPEGLAVLDDGSLLVCNNDSGVIHRMTADMKELYTIPGHTCKATFVFYHPNNQEVYFGCANEPTIKVFNLQYNHQSV